MLIFVRYENIQKDIEIMDESLENIISKLEGIFNIDINIFDVNIEDNTWGSPIYEQWEIPIKIPLSLYTENGEVVTRIEELSEMDKITLMCSKYEDIACKDQILKLFRYYDEDDESDKYDIYPIIHYYLSQTDINFNLKYLLDFCAKDCLTSLLLSLADSFCNNIDADEEDYTKHFTFIAKLIDYVLDKFGKPDDLRGKSSTFLIYPEFYSYSISNIKFNEITPMAVARLAHSDQGDIFVEYLKRVGLDDDPLLSYGEHCDKIKLSQAFDS